MCEKFFKKIWNDGKRDWFEVYEVSARSQDDNSARRERGRGRMIESANLYGYNFDEWSLRYTCVFALKTKVSQFPRRVTCLAIFSLWPSLCTARYNHPQSVVGQELWNWLSTPSLSHSPLSSRTNFVPAQSGVRLFELILTSALYLVLPRIRFSERLRESRWKISPLQSDVDYAYDILSRMIMLFVRLTNHY